MPTRWACLVSQVVLISQVAFCLFGRRTQCNSEGTNRAWDERPLCHVIPVNAFSTPRGMSARCAGVVPVSVWRICTWYERPLCRVVPFKAFATLRGMKARCAECGSGQRGSAERSCSCRFSVIGVCLSLAFYRSSRPTRACSGRRFASSEIGVIFRASICYNGAAIYRGGAAKAQPVGPQ